MNKYVNRIMNKSTHAPTHRVYNLMNNLLIPASHAQDYQLVRWHINIHQSPPCHGEATQADEAHEKMLDTAEDEMKVGFKNPVDCLQMVEFHAICGKTCGSIHLHSGKFVCQFTMSYPQITAV